MNNLLLGPDGLAGTAATDADNGSLVNHGPDGDPATADGIPTPAGQVCTNPPTAGSGCVALTDPTAGNQVGAYMARVIDEDDPFRNDPFARVTPGGLSAADIALLEPAGVPTNDQNSTVIVAAWGFSGDGVTVTRLEAAIGPLPGATSAIVTNGNLTISGDPIIQGVNGGVHANGDLDVSGDPNIEVNLTSSGSYTESGNPIVGGSSGGGAATQDVPAVAAIDYKPAADYILKADGTMTNPGGGQICNASADNDACKTAGYPWKFTGSEWEIESATINNDNLSYYLETDAKISANPGEGGPPLHITIIAEGNIEVSGNPWLEADTPELLFVTDGDLKINGNMQTVGAEAAMLVHEQFEMSGNGIISGQVMIEDAPSVSTLVDTTNISGNGTITSTATLSALSTFDILSWREW